MRLIWNGVRDEEERMHQSPLHLPPASTGSEGVRQLRRQRRGLVSNDAKGDSCHASPETRKRYAHYPYVLGLEVARSGKTVWHGHASDGGQFKGLGV